MNPESGTGTETATETKHPRRDRPDCRASGATTRSLVRALPDQGTLPRREELVAHVDGIEYFGGPVTMIDLHVPRTYPSSRDADGA